MTDKQIANQWHDATIRDNFVFGKTMELYPDLCRQLLELILDIKIKEINYPEREKTIEARIDGKGIRLDVYVEEKGTNRSFDVEIQISNSDNIAKRMRYYQSLIDTDKLKRGQHYSRLGESFIIFICPFDIFKQGRHLYTFRERCDQDRSLALGDGTTKIFLSTKGTLADVSPDIKAFLDYVDSGIVSGDFVKELAVAVDNVKTNAKVRHDFMTLQMALLESKMEGRIEGEIQKAEGIALKMIRKGKSFEEIQEFTDLPAWRINELTKVASQENDHVK